MVWGPIRKKYGVKPFHNAKTPSFLISFIKQSNAPEYSPPLQLILPHRSHFIICRRVLMISTGSDTKLQNRPDVSDEAMYRPSPSVLNKCHFS